MLSRIRGRLGIFLLLLWVAAAGRIAFAEDAPSEPEVDYTQLQLRVVNGQASFPEVVRALSDADVARLVNTVHMMHSQRWQRASVRLLLALWRQQDTVAFPGDLNPERFAKPPVRLALASTLLRMEAPGRDAYLRYLLEHRYDAHEFHRAQVVIGLGLNRNPKDVDYLEEMASSGNDYVVQAAVTALGLMQDLRARQALGRLWERHRGGALGELIEGVLARVYRVTPHVRGEGEGEAARQGALPDRAE